MDRSLYELVLSRSADLQRSTAVSGRPPRSSAAVVPWRQTADGGLEVYWAQRSPALRFMGGWHAFPGGGLDRSDAGVTLVAGPEGASEDTFTTPERGAEDARDRLGSDLASGIAACAVRELYEELGILLTESPTPDRDALRSARKRLLNKETTLDTLAGASGWSLSAARLVFAGRWLTPPFAPLRFDNRFFLLEWGPDQPQQPTLIDGGELVDGEWISPARAFDRWRSGDVLAAPPILHILKVLAEDGPVEGLGRLREPEESYLGPFRRVELRPGVILMPLETPTLPPATHTNAFLLGRHEVVLIDPATPLETETERLRQALGAAQDQGLRISAIWLTHHHPDHIGAVETLRRELDVPVAAHPLSVEPLRRFGIEVDHHLEDGQVIELDGDPSFPVQVFHTPGHTRGHLCFYDQTCGSLIAGDLLSALSTIVIDPPEGDMDAYLTSLAAMAELGPRTLFPAHGPAILAAVDKLEEFRHHRLEREAQIRDAWKAGKRRPEAMVAAIYPDVPPPVHGVAARQVQAHLDRLRKLGEIT